MSEDRRFSFEKIAKLDSPERRQRQPPAPLVELIASWKPGALLDIGAGTGYFTIPLAAALPDATIVGTDVEPRMFEVLQQRAGAAGCEGRITLQQTPAERLLLEGQPAFDVALMVALYHELEDRRAYLTGVRAALAPGGRLVLCDWCPEDDPRVGPPNSHRVALQQAHRDLEAVGFSSVERHELYSPSFYLLVAR